MRLLADYVIARHYPEAAAAEQPYRALLDAVVARQADLVARWLLVGFIHGVMNTDNTSIAGETIDYGPCAFMDAYDPATVFSSIDHLGRYAYGNQPRIAQWNLARLAETLLPLLAEDEDPALAAAQEALAAFGPRFEAAYLGGLRRKLGLATEREGDAALGPGPAGAHGGERRRLHPDLPPPVRRGGDGPEGDAAVRALFADAGAYDAWAARWRRRLARGARGAGGAPCRHAGGEPGLHPAQPPRGGRARRRRGRARISARSRSCSRSWRGPTRIGRACERYAAPPEPEERVHQTFCGT